MRKYTGSSWKTMFRLLLGLLLLAVAATVFLRVRAALRQDTLADQQQAIAGLERQIAAIEDEPGYNKLDLVTSLIQNTDTLPWSKHIPEVISMLQEIQNVDESTKDRITLSDFRVSLDEIELRGSVSRLLLLYYTSEERGFTGLIDRFKQLDFIDNIRIQTYQREGDDLYEFTLHADVVLDDSTTTDD